MKSQIDTNILLRFVTKKPKNQAERAKKFLNKVIQGRNKYLITVLSIAEIIWALETAYKQRPEKIAPIIKFILTIKNLKIIDKDILKKAIELYKHKNIDFIDAYNAMKGQKMRLNTIYSFDKDFDKIISIKRLEP